MFQYLPDAPSHVITRVGGAAGHETTKEYVSADSTLSASSVSIIQPWYHGFIYSEQLWFPLNEIHHPQLRRVNQGKPQLQTQQLMGSAYIVRIR